MALSSDPERRAAQLANLKRGPVSHGAFSEPTLAPLRGRFAEEFTERFPSADPAEVSLLATRQAQLHVLGEWIDGRGMFQNKQRGTIAPPVELHERLSVAFEKQFDRLRERERERPLEAVDIAETWRWLRERDDL